MNRFVLTMLLMGCEPVVEVTAPENVIELTGFPCDVRNVLQTNCAGCHSSVSYAKHFKSRQDFHGDFGALAVKRMNDTQQPMPPMGVLHEAERSIITNWVNAGLPAGECADLDE